MKLKYMPRNVFPPWIIPPFGQRKRVEPQKEGSRERWTMRIQRRRQKDDVVERKKLREIKTKKTKRFEKRQCSRSDTRGPLISGSACLGPQLSYSSRRSLLCFLFEIPGGRLIQYNRVHFVPICMYRWLISRNEICRRAFPLARRAFRLSVDSCPTRTRRMFLEIYDELIQTSSS